MRSAEAVSFLSVCSSFFLRFPDLVDAVLRRGLGEGLLGGVFAELDVVEGVVSAPGRVHAGHGTALLAVHHPVEEGTVGFKH